MPASVAQRLLGLAAVALLAGVVALALIEQWGGAAGAAPTPVGAVAAGGALADDEDFYAEALGDI